MKHIEQFEEITRKADEFVRTDFEGSAKGFREAIALLGQISLVAKRAVKESATGGATPDTVTSLMTMGQRIKFYREGLKINQEGLATQCGVSLAALKTWEQDKKKPGATPLAKVCLALNVSILELVPLPTPQE